jgi:hypothetical protein
MAEWHSTEPIGDLEALIRSARDYVHASEDLRPRVLETARSQRHERVTLTYLQFAAIVLVLLGLLTAALRSDSSPNHSAIANALPSPAPVASGGGDSSWGLVESFTELRRRQAVLLGSTVDLPRRNS